MDKRKIIYFTDELNDEFSTAQIKPRIIDGSYIYCHNSLFKRFTRLFWYRAVATPVTFLYVKLFMHRKVFGKEKLKPFLKKGYFMYGNHTHDIGDAMTPTTLNFPQQNYCIVHANNVSMPILGKLTPSFGAIPLPDDKEAYKNFIQAIERRIKEGHTVVIYPEAHIWPYYTKIRPFSDVSFQYAVKLDVPVFCFTNTYQKRKFSKKPKTVTYIDGPFFVNNELSLRERRKDLRDRVFDCMCERAKNSNIECIKYVKREENNG